MRHTRERHAILHFLHGNRTRPAAERADAAPHDHHHFFCTRCGRMEDAYPDLPATVKAAVARGIDRDVSEFRLQFFGLCADCEQRAEAAAGDQ